MSGFSANNEYWNGNEQSYGFNEEFYQSTQEFQTFGDEQVFNQDPQQMLYLDPNKNIPNYPGIYDGGEPHHDPEYDEPPLLEELEIYPERILEKVLAVLNPFHKNKAADDAEFLLRETDIAGPVAFCIILGLCLFLSGNKAHFGYIYGLSVMSVLFTYTLFTLMCLTENTFSVLAVASVLGYSLIPIVWLAILGLFLPLQGLFGTVITFLAVSWSSLSASKLYITITGDAEQRILIAYPCALVYGVFALIVVF